MPQRKVGLIEGVIQGVGFRPFVSRLASELGLGGFVRNEGRLARIEVEGEVAQVAAFTSRLAADLPAPGRITAQSWRHAEALGELRFRIEASALDGPRQLTIPPDLAACSSCLAEVSDEAQRRHLYPFTNCAHCGPRFSIVADLPYDRARTSMAGFALCAACEAEYSAPTDRRYHAQPIACARCGPRLRAMNSAGGVLAEGSAALQSAQRALLSGQIVALKGMGGFQLLVDATAGAAVRRLRARKQRPEKPLAVMARDLAAARELAHLELVEETALASPAAPIVLARAFGDRLAAAVTAGNARVGLMLPSTPLHHLLLRELPFPVVCTSGNRHQEPIAREDLHALEALRDIADLWLMHDRPILHRIDDGVVQLADGRVRVLRLGRGLGPIQLALPGARPGVLCTGSHLNNAPAATLQDETVLWPHVGDLDSAPAEDAFAEAVDALTTLLAIEVRLIACDAHPDYASTRWADARGIPTLRVHHHHAHVAACLAEHGVEEALGVVWDGVGLGADGTAWGGEFLHVSARGSRRVAHLRSFRLPGGDAASRDGLRALAGACAEAGVDCPAGAEPFSRLVHSPTLSPRSSSAGRLFDAVAAWLGLCERSSFEGQAAMAVEHCAHSGAAAYPFRLAGQVVDWTPMFRAMRDDLANPPRASARFHATLSAMIVAVAERERQTCVVLAGGCMQNVLLVEQASQALRALGKRVLLAERVPTGDGAIALGQAWVASRAR
jgi:hydrogenase maturation protein HypF